MVTGKLWKSTLETNIVSKNLRKRRLVDIVLKNLQHLLASTPTQSTTTQIWFSQRGRNVSSAHKKSIFQQVSIKAMRLSKNFGLSTFPVFRHCPTFDGRNWTERKQGFRMSKNFAKPKPKLPK